MRTFIMVFAIASLLLSMVAMTRQNKKLTLETIFGGTLHESSPEEMHWAPDGRKVSYFQAAEQEDRSLWVFDVSAGRKTQVLSSLKLRDMAPSSGQAALSERERTRRDRYDVPSYAWSPDGKYILLSSSGQLYLYDTLSEKTNPLAPSKKELKDPKFSPDGKWVSFVWDHDIWAVPVSGESEHQLTFGGSELVMHGELDWLYQEEFDLRSGYQWSPDSRRIAFLELNQTSVPTYPIIGQLQLHTTVDYQRYPKVGDPNPNPKVGIVGVQNPQNSVGVQSLEDLVGVQNWEYIPRMDWAEDGGLILQLLNRSQNELRLVEVNPETGASHTLLTELDAHWIDVRNDLKFISGGREFLWTSDRSGFRHIYLYDRSGKLIRQLTGGEWVVSSIEGVDEKNGWIYYTSNQASVLGRDLFRIRKDASAADKSSPERITPDPGTHEIIMNLQANACLDSVSSLNRRQEIRVRDLVSGRMTTLFRPSALDEFELVNPEMKLLQTPDGSPVRILLYRPASSSPQTKHPVLVYTYGMPGVPSIQDIWTGNRGLFHQYLVQQGYVIALVDDRASAIPGHKYAVAAYKNVGPIAAKDHEFAVQYLKSLPYVDADAIAIWGWSGGGFMAAYHMTHTSVFKAAIAGAPVTDWRLYDSVYTERYMGLPSTSNDAYERTSCVAAAGDYRGRLLLIYGTHDDNVHPQHTIQLVNALIKNKKQFDLMEYPEKTHGITGSAESIHLYTMIFDFLQKNLRKPRC